MNFRPLARGIAEPWLDAMSRRDCDAKGLAARIVMKHLGSFPARQPYANDRDHCPW